MIPNRLGVAAGLTVAEPQVLSGEAVVPPTARDQTEALGDPAAFPRDVVESRWQPRTDWEMDPATRNEFAPTTWIDAPIDPTWTPEPAWADEDAMAGGRSTWQKSIIDSSWKPTNGFDR